MLVMNVAAVDWRDVCRSKTMSGPHMHASLKSRICFDRGQYTRGCSDTDRTKG